ncbi:hypothetical protein [Caballeronia sp. LZ034LL]|uniref:hypothetical protein n=1 Tax=Caballeronia sp. LZ034LL TaxID=3038567 RepID=UPI0028607561|nr:hypothetical protein [Caballeronia sp. LZ034LL]MDR5839292.1 hypothetical protein [Caballeronia sp. LZ034LL]
MAEKKYGGHTLADIKEMLKQAEDNGEGLDSLVGDEAFSSSIISDMIAEIEKSQKEKV